MSAIISPPVTPAPPQAPAVAWPPLYRLSVAQYHAMGEHAILTPEDRVELIHGLLVTKAMKNAPHRISTNRVRHALTTHVPTGWHFIMQDPITLTDSEPEPDASVVRGNVEDYDPDHPGPSDVGLVVEISDSSLQYDRATKKEMYAAANIPIYWIVNVVNNQIEVFTDPTGPGAQPAYATEIKLQPTDEVALILDGREFARIPVASLLPP